MMRAAAALLCGAAMSAAPVAHAWRLSLETPYTGGSLVVGDRVEVSLYLDTQADTGLQAMLVGVVFDRTRVRSVVDASVNTTYILYSPTEGKGRPAFWLDAAEPSPWQWDDLAGGPESAAMVRFEQYGQFGSRATPDNELMARLTFEVIGCMVVAPCTTLLSLSTTVPPAVVIIDTIEGVGSARADISEQVILGPGVELYVAPEPGTGVLVGIGLVALAARRRPRCDRCAAPPRYAGGP